MLTLAEQLRYHRCEVPTIMFAAPIGWIVSMPIATGLSFKQNFECKLAVLVFQLEQP